MAATSFNTENRTFRQLIGNGLTYRVPPFQRDYSWGDSEWEDLWADILGTIGPEAEPAHYMGYLVLQTSNNRSYEVIDGQQRLTTISLLVLAAMRILDRLTKEEEGESPNKMRLRQLRSSYIGYIDPVSLVSQNKLTLNRNNDGYYKDYIVSLSDHLPQRGFPASTHSMRKAYEWYEKKLWEHLKSASDIGVAIAQFVEHLSDKLFFTVITVADELNAYKVFETLNARGVRLSATDLLKNWLFSVLAKGSQHDQELAELERRWESMVGRLGSESFPDFLRMHWNSRKNFARQSELFKAIRSRVQKREDVFALLQEMDQDIETYLALTQPDGAQWPLEWKNSARELRLFSVRQPFPMIMAAKRKLSDSDFGDLLKAVVVIAFRFNIIGSQHTSEQERVYHQAAVKLESGDSKSFTDTLNQLKSIYRSDVAFKSDFAEKSIKTTQTRNAKLVRYILSRIERQSGGIEFDPDSASYSLEHILPQSPDQDWSAFSDRDLEAFIYRLGNMVILEAGKNKSLGNAGYLAKRSVLAQSGLLLTRQLAQQNDDWTPERLTSHQKRMAKTAASIWRVQQLS